MKTRFVLKIILFISFLSFVYGQNNSKIDPALLHLVNAKEILKT